ncbi:MAG: APC family permease [Anaerolineales bacterium]|nr:APC family permease [Anaerolineales bacterium]
MLHHLRDVVLGPPLPTGELGERRLNKIRALAAFSPDALSSIAYANQEIYLGLVVAGSAGLSLAFPVAMAIVGVLLILALSYFQTIHAYPSGGGSWIVARANLGIGAGLVAAAALLLDYVLVAAVSLTAGVEAIASAFPVLWPYRVTLALVLLLLITLLNLRGLRETGTLISVPVYAFLGAFFMMLAAGVWRAIEGGPQSLAPVAPPALAPLTLVLVLHAFATGCTALTGIEAISNGVPAFRPPESKNAGQTLLVMAVLMTALFAGSIGLTQFLAVVPGPQETVLSALARTVLGRGWAYYVVQTTTLLVLAVAANTSFMDYPRVAALLAKEGFLPRQLTALGDRLVFANGILTLSFLAGVLIVIYRGNSHSLIPLFAIGAFLAFTLSQAGMVVHWWKEKGRGWRLKAGVNALGALVTGLTVMVIAVTKFVDGAWITLIVIPGMILVFLRIRSHYAEVARELSLRGLPPSLKPVPLTRLVIPVASVHRGVITAVDYAQGISSNITAVHVELEPGSGEALRRDWERWFPAIPLVVMPSPYRSMIDPLLRFLDETDLAHNDGQLATLVLPEFVPARWWQALLHNQTAWLTKAALLYRRRTTGLPRVVIDVPYYLRQ